jgi:hypothetical protein
VGRSSRSMMSLRRSSATTRLTSTASSS